MRKLLLLALLCGVCGCQAFGLAGRKKDTDSRGSDPFYSPDLEEQQRAGRSRYAYPEDDRTISPPGFSGRPTPSGR
jgi:hypothetical protein